MIGTFLPVFLVPLIFFTYLAASTSRMAITEIATNFLQFKSSELLRFAAAEDNLLRANNLAESPEFVQAAKESIASYARALVRSPTEIIVALDDNSEIRFSTGELLLTEAEKTFIRNLHAKRTTGWVETLLGDVERVADASFFDPYGWIVLVTEQRDSFFKAVDRIRIESLATAAVSLLLVSALVIVFSSLLTRPLRNISGIMREIVHNGKLSQRVLVDSDDEIGELGDSFNAMTGSLEQAYNEIKNYALQAAIARKREMKIRNIFQKFVPKHVIDEYFAAPESMLVGAERNLAILFSDIRNFTTISEEMNSRDIVESLNQYFDHMVDRIMKNQGIVDKYIGDAIMAFFGAPAEDPQSALHAVQSALDMIDALQDFNSWQVSHGKKPIQIGIGINFGAVTIGNIGTERKMEYTVIGDMVNIASRIEGLTKYYHEPVLISNSVHRFVKNNFPCRLIDKVVMKGKTQSIEIYSVQREVMETEAEAWELHHQGLTRYYSRDFEQARVLFTEVHKMIPGDFVSRAFLQRCHENITIPPGRDWTGVATFDEK